MHLSVSAGKLNLDHHMTTVKHKANCKKLVQQPTILQATSTQESPSDRPAKEGEVRMAIFIAEHNLPIAVADHLLKFIRQVCEDFEIAKKVACARMKTIGMIKNVTGECSRLKLCGSLQNSKFSLIIDESTDVFACKHPCIVTVSSRVVMSRTPFQASSS